MGLRILLLEDLDEDIFFMKRALDKTGLVEFFFAVHNGEEAIDYLQAAKQFSDRKKFPFPTVVVTDLKMPMMDGFSFLRWAKSHPECGVIPTIVFTASNFPADVKLAYELGANAYLKKPNTMEQLVSIIHRTNEFWTLCEVPEPPVELKCR